MKTYQRYSALEKCLFFGKCELVLKRESLLDKAKRLYRSKLLEGASAQATIDADPVNVQDSTYSLSEGWALKSPKRQPDSMMPRNVTSRINLCLDRKQDTS